MKKKLLSLILVLAMCLSVLAVIPSVKADAASSHVYMIGTFPGEDCNTTMNIGWHSDYEYTNCYVEYTVKSDADFKNSKTAKGTYDSDDYLWFYNRIVGLSNDGRYNKVKFLNWGTTLKGLTPDTDYIYRIWDGKNGACSEVYNFKTSGAENFSILWLSDDHVFSSFGARLDNWVAMYDHLKTLAKYEIGFQFSTGDSVASGDRYGDWLTIYEQDFVKEMMLANLLGNHDAEDAVMQEDPNYTQYWKSSQYFTIVNNVPKNGYVQTNSRIKAYLAKDGLSEYENRGADELISYDPSNPNLYCTGAVEDTNGTNYWFKYNNCLFIMFDFWTFLYSSKDRDVAFAWAEEVIEQNKGTYDYLICADHNNLIWGSGGGSRYYTDYWQPFLDKNNVDIFLAGDNHVYARTPSLLGGQVNTDPSKGTYIVQAPCLSRGPSVSLEGAPSGFIEFQYANGSETVGGIVLDVTSEGITFTMACKEGDNFRTVDVFTIPKKLRIKDIEAGYYTTTADVIVKETCSDSASALTTVPKGTVIEVVKADGHWGLVRYNGFTGWALIGNSAVFEKAPASPSTLKAFPTDAIDTAYKGNDMHVFTAAYGDTIASADWSYTYTNALTAVRDENGAYKVTAINSEAVAKNTTPIPDNGLVMVFTNEYNSKHGFVETVGVGDYFTLDKATFNIFPVNVGEKNPVIDLDKVPTVALGDVNGDGYADSLDAAAILQVDAGLKTLTEAAATAADVNGDGYVDSLDAAKVLQFDAGIISKLN